MVMYMTGTKGNFDDTFHIAPDLTICRVQVDHVIQWLVLRQHNEKIETSRHPIYHSWYSKQPLKLDSRTLARVVKYNKQNPNLHITELLNNVGVLP